MDARRTETTCVTPTCVVPRHVDLSGFFCFVFFSERADWGVGGGAARLFLLLFFPVQQITSGIGHRVK